MLAATAKLSSRPRHGSASQTPKQPPNPPLGPQSKPTIAKRARKGYKKSRSGCFNCKRRKIKCQENKPTCHNCNFSQFQCVYPADVPLPGKDNGKRELMPQPTQVVQLQATPTYFSPPDMRLFHHFLHSAYPHLPLGNERVWVTEIASSAHQYDFLIHAVLAMAASHLTMSSTSPLSLQGLSHRVKAVEGLNRALATPPTSKAQSDAMLAACYALCIQSSFLGDSVEEWLTMLRGSQLITAQGWNKDFGSSFTFHDFAVQARVPAAVRIISPADCLVAKEALQQIGALCRSDVERRWHGWLFGIIKTPNISSLGIWYSLCTLLVSLTNPDFSELIDTSNPVMQLLMAQFIGILNILYALQIGRPFIFNGRFMGIPNRPSIFKVDSVIKNVPAVWQGLLEWPTSTVLRGFVEEV